MSLRVVVVTFAVALITGCASTPKHSDFLGDMRGFEKAQNGRDAVYWVKPGLTREDVLSYQSVIIEPVSILLSPSSEHSGIRSDEVVAISEYYREALVKALEPRYPVVTASGPHVLRIRPAITDIHRNKPISPLEFTPVGLALKGVETVTGMPSPREMLFGPSPFNEASVEMEFLDSKSNQRLVAFRDTRKGAKRDGGKGEDATWGEIKDLLDQWAADVRRILENPRKPDRF